MRDNGLSGLYYVFDLTIKHRRTVYFGVASLSAAIPLEKFSRVVDGWGLVSRTYRSKLPSYDQRVSDHISSSPSKSQGQWTSHVCIQGIKYAGIKFDTVLRYPLYIHTQGTHFNVHHHQPPIHQLSIAADAISTPSSHEYRMQKGQLNPWIRKQVQVHNNDDNKSNNNRKGSRKQLAANKLYIEQGIRGRGV